MLLDHADDGEHVPTIADHVAGSWEPGKTYYISIAPGEEIQFNTTGLGPVVGVAMEAPASADTVRVRLGGEAKPRRFNVGDYVRIDASGWDGLNDAPATDVGRIIGFGTQRIGVAAKFHPRGLRRGWSYLPEHLTHISNDEYDAYTGDQPTDECTLPQEYRAKLNGAEGKWQWAAVDEDGEVYFYENKPEQPLPSGPAWGPAGGRLLRHAGTETGCSDWTKSLYHRGD